MRTSESVDKVMVAISKAKAEFGVVEQSGYNKFHGYRYSKLKDYDKATAAALADNGLSSFTSIDQAISLGERITKSSGIEYAVRVKITMRILHDTSEQWIETTSFGDGQDGGDKGIYKAITGAKKYAISSTFNLVTDDDPETTHRPPNATNTPPVKKLAVEPAGAF